VIAALVLAALPVLVFAAGELQLSTSFIYTKSPASIQNVLNLSIDVAGTAVASGIISVGTTNVAVNMGDVTGNRYVVLQNLTTNSWSTLTYGGSTNEYPSRVNGNQVAIFRMNGTALHLLSVTNTINVLYYVLSP
jgi:hypothetical protein